MGNCFSSSEPSVPPTRFRLTSRNPRREEDFEVRCSQCQRSCGHTEGRFYLKCLQCSNDFNICDRCFVKDHYHPAHVYAFVDNQERHRFMQQIAKRMEGSPILSPVPSVEPRSPDTLKCFNLTTDDNLQPKKCPNRVSWICLQCPIAVCFCHSCLALPSQPHGRHVFAMANSDNLHNFILAQQHSGALPLTLNRTDE